MDGLSPAESRPFLPRNPQSVSPVFTTLPGLDHFGHRKDLAVLEQSCPTAEECAQAYIIPGVAEYIEGAGNDTVKRYFRKVVEAWPQGMPNPQLLTTEIWDGYREV